MDWQPHLRRIHSVLGEDAQYVPPQGGAPATVRGVFSAGATVQLDQVEGVRPIFDALEADLPQLAHGAAVIIRGVTYKVRAIEREIVPGLVRLVLEAQ